MYQSFFFFFKHRIKQIDSMLPWVRFSNRSEKTSKCGLKTSARLVCHFFVFTHFNVFYDLLLNRRTATWNIFVKVKIPKIKVCNLFPVLENVFSDVIRKLTQRRRRRRRRRHRERQKSNRFRRAKQQLHVHHAFLDISLLSLHDNCTVALCNNRRTL